MTEAVSLKPELGRFGVWLPTRSITPELASKIEAHYLGLSNYVNNWLRLGFTEDDVRKPGSDRLIDSVVAYGTVDAIAQRLNEHLDAGADHVAIQGAGRLERRDSAARFERTGGAITGNSPKLTSPLG